MPSQSAAQHGFAAMSTTAYGRSRLRAHGKTPMPVKVAQEYLHADRGKHFKSKHVRKKG